MHTKWSGRSCWSSLKLSYILLWNIVTDSLMEYCPHSLMEYCHTFSYGILSHILLWNIVTHSLMEYCHTFSYGILSTFSYGILSTFSNGILSHIRLWNIVHILLWNIVHILLWNIVHILLWKIVHILLWNIVTHSLMEYYPSFSYYTSRPEAVADSHFLRFLYFWSSFHKPISFPSTRHYHKFRRFLCAVTCGSIKPKVSVILSFDMFLCFIKFICT
jgi:hypothetical protein